MPKLRVCGAPSIIASGGVRLAYVLDAPGIVQKKGRGLYFIVPKGLPRAAFFMVEPEEINTEIIVT
jgi:hypothetical protein